MFNARIIGAGLVATAMLAGSCSSRSELDSSAEARKERSDVPQWLREAVALASPTSSLPSGKSSNETGAKVDSGLPDEATVVAALIAAGIPASQATCMYKGLSANPVVAKDAVTLLGGLTSLQKSSPATVNPASLVSLGGLSQESSTRVLAAIAPCVDQATLAALLAGAAGTSGTGTSNLLAGLSSAQLAALQSMDPNAIADLIGGGLPPEQLALLKKLLAAAKSGGTNDPEVLRLIAALGSYDISKLDLSKLPTDQMKSLLYLFVSNLSKAQQDLLIKLTQLDVSKLDINIDPSTLSPEALGGLLLIFSPALAASLSPTTDTPPAGTDPGKIYIPPGMDLSSMNPLLFLNRADTIRKLMELGFSESVSGCLLDSYARLPPAVLIALFSSTPNDAAITQVAFASFNCVATA